MTNMIYKKIHYINWKTEAQIVVLSNDAMVEKLKVVQSTRTKAESNTKRVEFDNNHYGIDRKGDYISLYIYENGKYFIYKNNVMDEDKNKKQGQQVKKVDVTFDLKFRELNGLSIRKAFGFVDKEFKRCIPKQFYFINQRLLNKILFASAIDACSQYPSGCLGRLPDSHSMIKVKGRILPSKEYSFAFYSSGHCAEYGKFDTHNWLANKFAPYLFRLSKSEPYPILFQKEDEEFTYLMKPSKYSMDAVWKYYFNIKNSKEKQSEEYLQAKLIMNKTIGCWHRKDKSQKEIMSYDDHGSYQLAHIVAIALARGNQKILDMIESIGSAYIVHVCVDGIIYLGDRKFGQEKAELGAFTQEFIGADFKMKAMNVYCAIKNGECVKFKHGGFDLLNGEEIKNKKDFKFEDLENLDTKERVGEIIKWQEK